MTQAYLYRWTENSSGKWYVGSRYAKGCHPNDGYICSSRLVKPLIKTNPEAWTREILVIGLPEYIRDIEARYLVFLNADKSEMSFNKSNGNGSFHTVGLALSEKQLRRLREDNPSFRADVREKLRIAGMSRDVSHLFSPDSLKKKSQAQKLAWAEGKFKGVGFKSGDENVAKNPLVRQKISEALKELKGGRMTGKKHSSETRQKMADARRQYWKLKRNAGQNYL
jgi:hypothetical protein